MFEAVQYVFRLYAEGLIDGCASTTSTASHGRRTTATKLRARLHALERERPSTAPPGPPISLSKRSSPMVKSFPQCWGPNGTTGHDFMDEVSALQHDGGGERPLTDLWGARQREVRRFRPRGGAGSPPDFAAKLLGVSRGLSCAHFIISRKAIWRRAILPACNPPGSDRDFRPLSGLSDLCRCRARLAAGPFVSVAGGRSARRSTCLPSDSWLVETLAGGRERASVLGAMRRNCRACPISAIDAALLSRKPWRIPPSIATAGSCRETTSFDPRPLADASAEFHRPHSGAGGRFPALDARDRHTRSQARRGRARAARCVERVGRRMDPGRRVMDRALRCALRRDAPRHAERGRYRHSASNGRRRLAAGTSRSTAGRLAAYAKRIAAWQQKALREAKLFSDWSAPNESYERAARELVAWLLAGPSELLAEIADFARRIAPAGAVNGLAQALLKLTAPGVPDHLPGRGVLGFQPGRSG